MSDLPHLRLEDTATPLPYISPKGGGGTFRVPPRDRAAHAEKLLGDLREATSQIDAAHQAQVGVEEELAGYSITLRSDAAFGLKLDSLERHREGIELLSVRQDGDVQVANLFVRRDKLVNLLRTIERYAQEDDRRSGKPRNQKLVESIASIRMVALRDLWQDDQVLFPADDLPIWWEVWLRAGSRAAHDVHARFAALARSLGIRVSDRYVTFPERVVTLVWATARQIGQSVDLLAQLAELRKGKEVPTEYLELPAADQRAFVREAVSRLVPPSPDAPAVCLLDTGVNRNHPLIEPALSARDMHAVDAHSWGTSDHDPEQHGTAMAGIALYRCLTDVFSSSGPIQLQHRLESVKLLPPPPQANAPEVYGWVTQQAVARAEIEAPTRNRAICMAVTADDRDMGLPSSWSAAVDQMCSGQLDGKPKLMFISTGNYSAVLQDPQYQYFDWNCRRAGIQDPAQAWNAVTVGGYTEKTVFQALNLSGWYPIAGCGDLCPTSRTSLPWLDGESNTWPIKPDIVMEAGNYVTNGRICDCCTDLSLLTTMVHPSGRLLSTMHDTSAATAAAARMAAIVWSRYPKLWPESVRALLVHSAQWTQAMVRRFPGNTKGDIQRRLRCFGYGVPQLPRALYSAKNAATLIYEGELQPFQKVAGEIRTREMHLHRLPWPAEILADLGEHPVTMRVTLSYFIEPSPGRKGWGRKHRFRSHGLRFDVINSLENEEQFQRRISRAMWEDQQERPENIPETRNWTVGPKGRTRGSIHSDWWQGTASELAACNRIAVYPVTGWWRERPHLNRWNRKARYTLVITIETSEADVDLYTAIMNQTVVSTVV